MASRNPKAPGPGECSLASATSLYAFLKPAFYVSSRSAPCGRRAQVPGQPEALSTAAAFAFEHLGS